MIPTTTLLSAALAFLPLGDSASAQEVEKLHESVAIVQIHYPEPIALSSAEIGPNYIANEIASLSLGEVALVAAGELQIEAQVIREALKVTPVVGTDFARISASTSDPALSKSIAEEITRAYVIIRGEREREIAETKLIALEEELTSQGDVVSENRNQLTILIQQYGVPYLEGAEIKMGTLEEAQFRSTAEKLTELVAQKLLPQAQFEVLANAKPEFRLRTALAIEIPENPVVRAHDRHLEAVESLSKMLATGLGEDHPSVIALKAQEEKSHNSTNEAVAALKDLLEAKLQILDRQIERSREAVDKSQERAIDLSLKQHKYNQARRDYESSLALYEQLKERQQEGRVALHMPKTPLTIRQRAE